MTNDKFRDYMSKLETNPSSNDFETVKREKAWLKQHCISFTFKGDEFLPNPDCKLFTKFAYETYKQFKEEDDDSEIFYKNW